MQTIFIVETPYEKSLTIAEKFALAVQQAKQSLADEIFTIIAWIATWQLDENGNLISVYEDGTANLVPPTDGLSVSLDHVDEFSHVILYGDRKLMVAFTDGKEVSWRDCSLETLEAILLELKVTAVQYGKADL